jgi:transcriptional regulator with XRE-family HTH domain
MSQSQNGTKRDDTKRGAALATKIKKAREKKGFSQERLASLVGVSTDTIRKIEQKATTSPGVFLIVDIANALKVDLKKFVSGK